MGPSAEAILIRVDILRGQRRYAYLDSGEAGRAVPHLEAALETDEDGSLHFQLARAYQANGQADLARETRKKFQEIQRAANARSQGEKEEFTITPP